MNFLGSYMHITQTFTQAQCNLALVKCTIKVKP